MYDNGIFTSAYKELREGIAAKQGVIAKKGAAPAKKEDPKAKGGEEKGANTSDEDRVKQALYDIRYRAKRESVPVGQAMTDYLKHSGSLGPKARAELKKRLMGEEVVDEGMKPYPAEKVARKREQVKKKEDIHIARGEYDKADKQYKRGVSLAMKTKMRKEEVENEEVQLDEISANLALTASQKADEVRRKAAVSGDKETAAKKAKQASRLWKGVASRRAKERMAKEEVDGNLDEGLRDAVKGLLGRGKKEEKKPESRGEQLRKKYNVGPERSDTSAKKQILNRTRAKAERDKKEFGGSRYSKSVADKSKAAHDRYLKGGYSKYGADDARGKGNKARKRAAALSKEELEMTGLFLDWEIDAILEAFSEGVHDIEVIEEGLKQARKNIGMDPNKPSCWDGYKAKGTKTKGGKEVPNCVKENEDEQLQKRQLQLNRKKLQVQTKATQQKKKTDMSMRTEELIILNNILENVDMSYMHEIAEERVKELISLEEGETQKKGPSGDTLYKVRVVNNDGRSEVRYASRAKISELRGNSNIKSVEITGHGDAYNEKPKKGGEKKLDPVGKEDGDVDNDGDKDSSDKYLMKRRKAIGKAIATKEETETLGK